MGRKLYVGNLPYTVTETTLSDKFAEFGTVESIKLITDRDTGQSKGFGFIEMGTDCEGRAMNVNEAKPRSNSRGGGGGGGGGNRW
jgi:RNA recognition motif-containing protein